MFTKSFIDFSITLLYKDISKYLFNALVFIFIVFILSSVMFVSQSIQNDLGYALAQQPQIKIQNKKAGKNTAIDASYIDELLIIDGISDIEGRVDGYYHFIQNNKYFHIVGDDSIDDTSMQIGTGIKTELEKFYYTKNFNFLNSFGEKINLNITNIFDKRSNIISNDLVLMSKYNAKEILDLEENEYSYLLVSVPNDSEIDFIATKIKETFPHLEVSTKKQMQASIDNLFYYKGGIFMVFYLVALVSFFILLKSQISNVTEGDKKEIAILRTLGYTISEIIKIKLIQNIIVAFAAFMFGIIFAYIYVFYLHAPFIKEIFLGSMFSNNIEFTPIFNFELIILLFIFSVIPYIAAVILPSWKIAISDMNEALK